MGIHDVPKTELIEMAAKELQKVEAVKAPQWTLFAKTGAFKDRQPARADWWHVRAAAILRRLAASNRPVGVQKLRTLYGGKKNKGMRPESFYRGSGSIVRKVLQQLEKSGFAKKVEKDLHKGRIITPQGMSFLGKIADAYLKEKNFVLPKKPEGSLSVTVLPKEKKAKAPRKRAVKKPAEQAAEAPAVAAVGQAKPARKRAPKKEAEAPESQEKPAEAKPEEKKGEAAPAASE